MTIVSCLAMEETQFIIGDEASCTDGVCGDVTRVVVDPVARAVTHLVIEPKHRSGLGRLVPLGLLDTTGEDVRLQCSMEAFEQLDAAEETQFLPGSNGGYGGYAPGQMLSWPYYSMGNFGMGGSGGLGLGNAFQPVVYDTVPVGEVTVRRNEQVRATDGDIGRVQGLIIDPSNHQVTHVLLQEGHLWGKKDVAIPMNAVTGVDDGIRLGLTKQEVQDLPPVDLEHD